MFVGALCDPDWIRTNDPQLRRLMLYPAELPNLVLVKQGLQIYAFLLLGQQPSKIIEHFFCEPLTGNTLNWDKAENKTIYLLKNWLYGTILDSTFAKINPQLFSNHQGDLT